MIIVNIRKQGGAAVITIPSDVLKLLNLEVGAVLELDVTNKGFTARPVKNAVRKRYSIAELLHGMTSEDITALNADTEWAREGDSEGREL